jgi:hypothetical protein
MPHLQPPAGSAASPLVQPPNDLPAPTQALPQLQPQAEGRAEPSPKIGRQPLAGRRQKGGWRRRQNYLFSIPHLTERLGMAMDPEAETMSEPQSAFAGSGASAPAEEPVPSVPIRPTMVSQAEQALSQPPVAPVKSNAKPALDLRGTPTRTEALRTARALAAKPAGRDPAHRWLWLRLGIGLAQGVALALLLLAHDRGIWPASESAVSNALLMAGLMAPLVLLEGLGEVEAPLLLLWSGTLGFVIATLGLWQQWRGGAALLPVATITLFALIAHITVRAALRADRPSARYAAWGEIAWTVMARLLVWGIITVVACLLIAWSNGLLDRAIKQLGVTLPYATILASILLLGLASAIGFAIAADGWLQRQAHSSLTTCAAVGLPVLDVAALALLGLYLLGMPIPPWAFLALAAALVVGVHFFEHDARAPRWQKLVQGVAGLAILGSTMAVGWELRARVLAHGWTDMRIYAAVAAGLFALYGLVYLVESLSAPRDAPASRLMDRACPVLALLVAVVCLMLSTPLLDPLALAVKSQAGRLQNAKDAAGFDFTWLTRQGGRFGQEALAAYEHRDSVQITPVSSAVAAVPPRPAPAALPRPAPAAAAIGANITFHSEGVFPVALLAQDWSGADVAPCLAKASAVCDAWFLDLDGDGEQEILLAYGDDNHFRANVLKPRRSRWVVAATLDSPPCRGLLPLMRDRGLLVAAAPQARWRDVLVAGVRLTPKAPPAPPPCPRS